MVCPVPKVFYYGDLETIGTLDTDVEASWQGSGAQAAEGSEREQALEASKP